MNPRALLLVALWPAVAGAAVPDPGLNVTLVPLAATSGPPAWVRPGTRLIYQASDGTLRGTLQTVRIGDENQLTIGPNTYEPRHLRLGAGVGFNVVDVGYVDHDVVALSSKLYFLDPLNGDVSWIGGAGGLVAHAGAGGKYWINPTALQQLFNSSQPGLHISRAPYELDGKTYNAVRIQSTSETATIGWVYDLDSGVLLVESAASAGAQYGTVNVSSTILVERRQLDLPGKDAAPVASIPPGTQLRYQGAMSTGMEGMGQVSAPMASTVEIKAAGPGWVRYTTTARMQSGDGMPPLDNRVEGASGMATLGGLWMSPRLLAGLRPGQELDRDARTRTVTTVSQVGGGTVTLTETGAHHRVDISYDATSGVLVAVQIVTQVGPGTTTTQLRLVR